MFKYIKRVKFIFKIRKFVPFLKDFFFSNEVPAKKKVIGVLFFLGYIIFPFDLIPDFLTFFGILDDFFIATFLLERLVKIAPDSLKQKYELIDKDRRRIV